MSYRQIIIKQIIQQTDASEHLVEEAFEKVFDRDKKIFESYLGDDEAKVAEVTKEANQKFDNWYNDLEEGWIKDTVHNVIAAIEQNSIYKENFCELFEKED